MDGDTLFDDEQLSMIFIMGVTGSGKSYFVNSLKAGSVREGADIYSETARCQMIRTEIGSKPVAIVDTPGFDDSFRSDEEILLEIVSFLVNQYQLGIRLKGILYLHRITDIRMQGSAAKYLEIFRKLCGDDALGNVVLATTMWSKLPDEGEGLERDQRLRDGVWKYMEERGSQIVQYDGSGDMAIAMVAQLMNKDDVVLKIQEELVDQRKTLDETEAAQVFVQDAQSEMREAQAQLEATRRHIARLSKPTTNDQRNLEKAERESRKKEQRLRGLKRDVAGESKDEIAKKSKTSKWKDSFAIFAAVMGLGVNIIFNLLPVLGVAI